MRYVAARIRPRPGEWFSEGTAVKPFAVLSHVWEWDGARRRPWHREKAGTIAHVHDVVQHELAGGARPWGRFGANAAGLRLALLAPPVVPTLTRLALPPEGLTARPKRLRFLVFTVPGRLRPHARQLWLRLATTRARLARWSEAVSPLPAPTYARARMAAPPRVPSPSRARWVRRGPYTPHRAPEGS